VPEARDVSPCSTWHSVDTHGNAMKRFFRIFELTKNEQRVVLIVIFALVAIAFVSYERRIHRALVQPGVVTNAKASPTPLETKDGR
jgi:hypothetical protein